MEQGKPGRGRVYDSITQTIGDTPLVRLHRMPQAAGTIMTLAQSGQGGSTAYGFYSAFSCQ